MLGGTETKENYPSKNNPFTGYKSVRPINNRSSKNASLKNRSNELVSLKK